MEVDTIELDTMFAAIMVPSGTQFTLEVDYGEKALLWRNRSGIDRGDGDYVLVAAKLVNGVYISNFDDSSRSINGSVI